jgi:hypothetical protein
MKNFNGFPKYENHFAGQASPRALMNGLRLTEIISSGVKFPQLSYPVPDWPKIITNFLL